ncbi:hypothetical protein [Hoeflea sp.]|uniref:hypothetical protein n=1 Tax=Hoeflea sp. TaxID=1940281 RepID=UPI003748518E
MKKPKENIDNPVPIHSAHLKATDIFAMHERLHIQSNGGLEKNYHWELSKYPELLSLLNGGGHQIYVRNNQRLFDSRKIPDLVMRPYGSKQLNIVELKGRPSPFIRQDGTIDSPNLASALRQLYGYRTICEAHDRRTDNEFLEPQLTLIGYQYEEPNESYESWLEKHGEKRWLRDYLIGRLSISTWQVIVHNLENFTLSNEDRAKQFFTDAITRSALKKIICSIGWRAKPIDFLQKLREAADERGFILDKEVSDQIIARQVDMLTILQTDDMLDLDKRSNGYLDDLLAYAELACYDGSQDFGMGDWIQGATGNLELLIKTNTPHHDLFAEKIALALERSNSEDVVCRLAMILRNSLDRSIVRSICSADSFQQKWNADDISLYEDDGLRRPHFIAAAQLFVAQATQGLGQGLEQLNSIARNQHLVSDVAKWHLRHGMSDPKKLLDALQSRYERPFDNVKNFRPWNAAIFKQTKSIFEDYYGGEIMRY